MYCTNCGQELPDNSKFCISCGEKVFEAPKDTKDDTESSFETPQETTVCKKCDAMIPANAEVCPYCGNFVNGYGRDEYGIPLEAEKIFCLHCGRTVAAGVALCPYCRAELKPKDDPTIDSAGDYVSEDEYTVEDNATDEAVESYTDENAPAQPYSSFEQPSVDNAATDTNNDDGTYKKLDNAWASVKKVATIIGVLFVGLIVVLAIYDHISDSLDPFSDQIGNENKRRTYIAGQEVLDMLITDELGHLSIQYPIYDSSYMSSRADTITFQGINYHTYTITTYIIVEGERWDYQMIIGLTDEDYSTAGDWYRKNKVAFKDHFGTPYGSDTYDCYYQIIYIE